MKKSTALHCLLSATLLAIACTAHCQKTVFIIADGIPADVMEQAPTPNIRAIIAQGSYRRAYVGGSKDQYNQTPTISAVGYNSLLTGTWVNKHNVWNNDIQAPNYHYPTIFRLFKNQYPTKKIAVFSSWLDNRTKLMGDSLPQTGYLHTDIHADGYELDTLRFPHDVQRNFMHRIDEQVATAAASSIEQAAPDLSWVYLEYTDDIGHLFGDSPQQADAIAKLDVQIGRIWKAVQYRQQHFGEKWLLVLTTDHGRDEPHGRNHGGQSPRQRNTWIVANLPVNAYAHTNVPAITDIMPTIARFMHLPIPDSITREIDGIPLTGPVSLAQPELNVFQHRLDITWQVLDTTGQVKVWVSNTNNFASGGKDEYRLMATLPVATGHVTLDAAALPSSFYKIALEGKYNTVNRWYREQKTGEK